MTEQIARLVHTELTVDLGVPQLAVLHRADAMPQLGTPERSGMRPFPRLARTTSSRTRSWSFIALYRMFRVSTQDSISDVSMEFPFA